MTGPASNATYLEQGREVLAAQPFSRLLGAELMQLAPGQCELAVDLREELLQQHGFAHGGVISYLADNALTYAGGSALGVPVVTGGYRIDYLRPGVGQRLVARAQAEHVGKSQAVCRCEVWVVKDGAEQRCALAQGTIVALPAKA